MEARSRWQRFAAFVFQPTKGAWNLIGAGVPGAVGAALWLYHHALLGAVLILVGLVVLLTVAGYRLQRRVEASARRQEVLNGLGLRLVEGEQLKTRITFAAFRAFDLEVDEKQKEEKKQPADDEKANREDDAFNAWLDGWLDASFQWQVHTSDYLRSTLGHDAAARFYSGSGLSMTEPHALFVRYVQDAPLFRQSYREVDIGCQRLNELISEVRNAPTS